MLKNIINVTKHPIRFWMSGWEKPIEVSPSGVVINARPVEQPIGLHPCGAELVQTKFVATEEEERKLDILEQKYPNAIIVGSIIAAQAFPGRVFALVPAPGFERVAPAEKRMLPNKFTSFGGVN